MRGRDARRRGAGDGPARPPRQAQAHPALRRPAAARRARPRAGQPPSGAAPRRAARRARPAPAQAAADPAQAHPAGGRHHLRARHARSGGGHDHGRHDRGDERRQDRAGGLGHRPLRAPPDGVRRELPRHLQPRRRHDEGHRRRHCRASRRTTAPSCTRRRAAAWSRTATSASACAPRRSSSCPPGRRSAGDLNVLRGTVMVGRLPRRLDPVPDQGRRAARSSPSSPRTPTARGRTRWPPAARSSSCGSRRTPSSWRGSPSVDDLERAASRPPPLHQPDGIDWSRWR